MVQIIWVRILNFILRQWEDNEKTLEHCFAPRGISRLVEEVQW